jgi:hypothetical protein
VPDVRRIVHVPASQSDGGAVKTEDGGALAEVSLPEVLVIGSM